MTLVTLSIGDSPTLKSFISLSKPFLSYLKINLNILQRGICSPAQPRPDTLVGLHILVACWPLMTLKVWLVMKCPQLAVGGQRLPGYSDRLLELQ